MLELGSLASFVVFAEHMNFTHAAEALHISQPALHTKIKKLSESVGVPLYRKHGRRLELTHAGRELLRLGRDIRDLTDDFLNDIRAEEGLHPVVLVAGAGTYLYVLGEGISAFVSSSQRKLRLMTKDREGSLEAVLSGEAHVGVAPLESCPPALESECLAIVPQVLVCPKAYPLASKKEVSLLDLEGASLIVPPADRPHRIALSRALMSEGVSFEVSVEAMGWELMIHFVSLGLGVAVVNGSCRVPEGLVARPLRELPSLHYHLFHRKGVLSKSVRTLKELLLKYAWQFEG